MSCQRCAEFELTVESLDKANAACDAAADRLLEVSNERDDALRKLGDSETIRRSLMEDMHKQSEHIDNLESQAATLRAQIENIADSDLMARMDKIVSEGMRAVGAEAKRVFEEELFKAPAEIKTIDDLVAHNRDSLVCDGFGAQWLKCDRTDCALAVVRPGRAKCEHPECPTSYKSE